MQDTKRRNLLIAAAVAAVIAIVAIVLATAGGQTPKHSRPPAASASQTTPVPSTWYSMIDNAVLTVEPNGTATLAWGESPCGDIDSASCANHATIKLANPTQGTVVQIDGTSAKLKVGMTVTLRRVVEAHHNAVIVSPGVRSDHTTVCARTQDYIDDLCSGE